MVEIDLAYHTNSWGTENLVAALADIASVGFRGVETSAEVVARYEDRTLIFNEMLAQHDICLVGITAGGQPLAGMELAEEVERSVNYARFLKSTGAKILALCAPMKSGEDEAEDMVPKFCEAFNEIGKRTLELGISTCLHPELGTLCENAKDIARFMEGTDSASVFLCPDLGHLAAASAQPEKVIKSYGKRVRHMHWKDYKPRRKSGTAKAKGKTPHRSHASDQGKKFVELGKGEISMQKVVDALNETGFSGWATIELEHPPRDPKECARASYVYAERVLDLVI